MTEQMETEMTSKTVRYVSSTNPDFIVEANYEMDVSQCGSNVCYITQYFLDDNKEHHYDMKIDEVDGKLTIQTFDYILIETDTLLKIIDEFKDMIKKVNDYLDEPYL
jgi:hypothetical protein